jgi:hypothetical protein
MFQTIGDGPYPQAAAVVACAFARFRLGVNRLLAGMDRRAPIGNTIPFAVSPAGTTKATTMNETTFAA